MSRISGKQKGSGLKANKGYWCKPLNVGNMK